MEFLFLCVIIFLFLLAVFDLSVGVSNDAVNFLNSALGSKAASFRTVLIIASIGVFLGAAMSNGMMDIARHGIFRPEHFSFYDLLCIFMAVMVTDIILLDIFNTLGMPTSTTVSMVFELLGATFVVALLKMAGDTTGLGFNDLLNTEKALSVIIGIFVSVAIAFFFGVVVQFLTRLIFSFDYRSRLKWKVGIYGGLCSTAIVYFLLIKGARDLAFMTPVVKGWIADHTVLIIAGCFVFFSVLMQLLHTLKVSVLKVVVMMGTFALAMAFAGNDLVNFIGVPLTGLSAYQDYAANGAGDHSGYMMGSLNGPSDTSVWFLVGAGLIMVVALATSRKARKVSQTEIGLGSQGADDEMFGSSRIARRLVRWTLSVITWVRSVTPVRLRRALARRFDVDESIIPGGAAFDLVRGSVNLVLAAALIALGTSLKLPLSTTFVTFMVAMGTSLADQAWGRESAVFRITGVMSVIGGWFLTAGAAFLGAGVIVLAMHAGGVWVIIPAAVLTVFIIVRSNRRFKQQSRQEDGDRLFHTILSTNDSSQVWPLMLTYLADRQGRFLALAAQSYRTITQAFVNDNVRPLSRADKQLQQAKKELKNERRKETLCLRHLDRALAIEKSAWFYLSNNCCMSMLYNLRRISEVCLEHVENNFRPLPDEYYDTFETVTDSVVTLIDETIVMIETRDIERAVTLRRQCDRIKDALSDTYHQLYDHLREGDPDRMSVLYVYLNLLQETQELVSGIRKYLRAFAKLVDNDFSTRRRRHAAV